MKRLIALVLCVCLCFVFAGCKDNEGDNGSSAANKDKYNLSTYLTDGGIPEAEFTLGTDIHTIIDARADSGEESDAGHTHTEFYHFEDQDYIQDGEIMYYYDGDTDKVTSIVCLSSGFGFEVGELTGKNDITRAFPSYQHSERNVSKSELYFVYGEIENPIAITYANGTNRLDFYFVNDSLLGVTLTAGVTVAENN